VGGGPAGSLLAHLLQRAGVDCAIVELRSKDHVLGRVRAGVIEHGSAERLRAVGLGSRMDAEGSRHHGVNLAHAGDMLRIDFKGLTGRDVMIFGQTELQKDLYLALEDSGVPLIDEAADVAVEGIETDRPIVSYTREGERRSLVASIVVGCDGGHGVSGQLLPEAVKTTYERVYPFTWVGVLSETPPVRDELIYANHDRGFALCSMRNAALSRYYVQGDADATVDDWPDDRFWEELAARLPEEVRSDLVTGTSIEKIVTPLRSKVTEPMRHGSLFLAGDVAHLVPPTGAKGLNLAISDVSLLADAIIDRFTAGSTAGLDEYSDRALARVWRAVRFSWWMTMLMHRFPGVADDFDRRLQRAELDYLFSSVTAQRSLAENYVGLPLTPQGGGDGLI